MEGYVATLTFSFFFFSTLYIKYVSSNSIPCGVPLLYCETVFILLFEKCRFQNAILDSISRKMTFCGRFFFFF